MGNSNRQQPVYNNDILDVNEPSYYNTDGAEVYGNSGYLELRIKAVNDIFIGSGFFSEYNNMPVRDFFRINEKAAIPGSSLKGCVRYIASVVSDGCLSKPNYKDKYYKPLNYRYPFKLKCDAKKNKCIICDMFGMSGWKSKVLFSDMICPDAKTEIVELNAQHSPKVTNARYHDGAILHGFKLYRNKCAPYKLKKRELVNVVKKGSVFEGRVLFNSLTDRELNLLCFSLGLGENINLKLGGYRNEGVGDKNEGMGQVEIRGKLFLDGEEKEPASFAARYEGAFKFRRNIEKVKQILKPYGGGADDK